MSGRGGDRAVAGLGGPSFGDYMRAKVAKLGDQFAAYAAEQAARGQGGGTGGGEGGGPGDPARRASLLFAGVTLHVNGLTTPSHADLRELMARHGGGFENYYRRSVVTHTICSNLTDAKVAQLAHTRADAPPVVRPEWVVDSLAAGRLLPTRAYLLCPPAAAPGPGRPCGSERGGQIWGLDVLPICICVPMAGPRVLAGPRLGRAGSRQAPPLPPRKKK